MLKEIGRDRYACVSRSLSDPNCHQSHVLTPVKYARYMNVCERRGGYDNGCVVVGDKNDTESTAAVCVCVGEVVLVLK